MGFLDSIGNGIGKIKEDMANKAAMNAQRSVFIGGQRNIKN